MNYNDLVEALIEDGEIEPDENIELIDYNDMPVSKDLIYTSVLGVYHNETTALVCVVPE